MKGLRDTLLVAVGARSLPAGGLRVLLVEDEPLVRAVQHDVLAIAGCRVVETGSAEDALELVRLHDCCFDVLVTDLALPGMHGCELAERLSEEEPRLGVVFTTGHGDDSWPSDRFPRSRFLQKPFGIAELADAVASVALA